MLEPSITQMLDIAEEAGLLTLEQAYQHYMRHYDLFFLLSDFETQHFDFAQRIKGFNFLQEDGFLRELTIDECRAIIQRVQNDDKA